MNISYSPNVESDPLTGKSMFNFCRTCMSTDTNLTSLFSVFSLSNKEEPLYSVLYKCTSIEVHSNDNLPENICNICLEKLAICYLFRELCFDTQTKLRELQDHLQKQPSFIGASAEEITSINTVDFSIAQGSYSAETEERIQSDIKNQLKLISDTKTATNQNYEVTENLHENCDFNYLGCDKENSCEESDVQKNCDIKNETFTCGVCSKNFSSKYSLNRHAKTHLDLDELKCGVCSKKFTRAADVKRHRSTHTGDKPYNCDQCNCSFTQSGTLAVHMRDKHGIIKPDKKKQKINMSEDSQEKSFLCSMCGRRFKHSSTLKLHLRRHLGERPYQCNICQLQFVSSTRLRAHSRVHTGERPFVCHICDKRFAQSTVLSRHLKSHADMRPHKCNYCHKRFFLPYDLNIHIRKHTGEKPLKCSICSRAFACPKILKQHQKTHSSEKPYLCMNCGKSFRRANHLKHHMKQHVKE